MSDATADSPTDFWDTNLLLGYTVDWDDFGQPVGTYRQERGSNREMAASTRAFEEAKSVVEKQRRRARQAADRVFEQFDSGRHDTVADVKQFVYGEFADDWGKVGPVLEYIDHHGDAFVGLAQTDAQRALRSTFEEIDEDFGGPQDAIQRLKRENGSLALRHFGEVLDSYEATYSRKHQRLDGLLDETDRDLLLDTHHAVVVTARQRVAFVTFDQNDIVDNRQTIEACLRGVSVADGWQFT